MNWTKEELEIFKSRGQMAVANIGRLVETPWVLMQPDLQMSRKEYDEYEAIILRAQRANADPDDCA